MTRRWLFVSLLFLPLLLLLPACNKASADPPAPTAAPAAAVADATGRIAVTVDAKGFSPSTVSFAKGKPASLVFTRTSDDTCAKEVVFPDLNVKKALPLNQAVTVEIPTAAARTLTFQCGMNMYKSSVVIN